LSTFKDTISSLVECKSFNEIIPYLKQLIQESPTLSNYIYAGKKYNEIIPHLNFKKLRVVFLRSVTIEPMLQYLKVKCYENGIDLDVYIADYNIFEQEILDFNSGLYKFAPDILVIFTRIEELAPELIDNYLEMELTEIDESIAGIIKSVENLVSIFRKNSKAKVIIHNFEVLDYPVFGIVDSLQEKSQTRMFNEINMNLISVLADHDELFILDYNQLIARVGKINWFDDKFWYTSKMPISRQGLEFLANEYMRFFKPAMGMTKKCLVLDLDNTLWGGVLGEEGINGIKIGTNYPGVVFLDFQKEILKLYNKGFILAINSKNNETDVMEVFEKNEKMVLKKHHFAAFRINWQDKALNMREIAEELSIGIDSFVFFDDNPVERELIKQQLPQVQVVEMPNNPIYYKKTLIELDCFEMLSYSEEDLKRGQLYYEHTANKIVAQN